MVIEGQMERKGYTIVDYDGTGMPEIQKIDGMDRFVDDGAAVEQAMKDGIRLIPVDELPEDFDRRYLGWIDEPGNRKAIADFVHSGGEGFPPKVSRRASGMSTRLCLTGNSRNCARITETR